MKALVKEAAPYLSTEGQEYWEGNKMHGFFDRRKKIAKFDGATRFCTVNPNTMVLGP